MCSENKGADQLRGYREPDLRLCFRIYKKPVFSRHGSNIKGLGLRCFIHSFIKIRPEVPGKNMFKAFLPYISMATILVM